MTELEAPDEATTLLVRRDPSSVADALDLHLRLDELGKWVDDRKRDVRGWALAKGLERKREDGAAPTWRVDDGSVIVTDPKPKPRIADRETFARWYLVHVIGCDPDEQPGADEVLWPTAEIVRREVASVDSTPLLDFLRQRAEGRDALDTIDDLAEHVRVDVEWLLPGEMLDDLLDGKRDALDDERPRLVLVERGEGWDVIDATTGESVPGVEVSPPGSETVQMKPDGKARTRVKGELVDLLGPPALER